MTNERNSPLKVGISSCLLGEKVRYNGGHKLDLYIRDTLGQFVQFVPVCPEVECGLLVPREVMRLEGDADSPRLMTIQSGVDHTEKLSSWSELRVKDLEDEGLFAFIFKKGSPSCGMEGVNVYDRDGVQSGASAGLFARVFMKNFPHIRFEDERRLSDATLRESFIEYLQRLKR